MFSDAGADGRVVISAHGDLDVATSGPFVTAAVERLGPHPLHEVVVDMTDAGFVGSAGLGALIQIRNAAHALGATTRLDGVDRRLATLLHIAGLEQVFLPAAPVAG